jgi:hypothetical protein
VSVRILAAMVLALEAAALAVLGGWQLVALAAGDTDSVASSLALIVLTVLAVAGLAAFATATARDRSWGRSGGIVAQVLILAVALGALTGIGADPLVAGIIALPAVVGAILLVLAVRRAGAERDLER